MGFWSRVWAAAVGKSMTVDEWWSEFGHTSSSAGGMAVTQLTALQVSTVQACVAIRSEDVAKLPAHVYRPLQKGGCQIAADHPLERLLQRPNDYQSRFEFVEQMQVSILLRGNAYAVILRDGRGRPTDLIPINPDRVWIYEAPGGEVFYQVARRGMHETALLKSEPLLIPSEDVFHLRWMALDNSLYGASRITLAREAIGLALSQQELAGRLSANSTNLGGVLVTDQKLTQEASDRLKKNWKDRQAGLRNAGETAVLEQGLKWQPMGMSARDAELVASRQFQVPEIARLYRMPLHKIGVLDAVAAPSMEQLDQDYMNSVVSSDLGRWEAKLGQVFGLAEQGLFVEFDVTALLRASQSARFANYRVGIAGSLMTPNEARGAEGLPAVEGGDQLYMAVNMAPIADIAAGKVPAGKPPGSDSTGAPAEGGTADPAATEDNAEPKD